MLRLFRYIPPTTSLRELQTLIDTNQRSVQYLSIRNFMTTWADAEPMAERSGDLPCLKLLLNSVAVADQSSSRWKKTHERLWYIIILIYIYIYYKSFFPPNPSPLRASTSFRLSSSKLMFLLSCPIDNAINARPKHFQMFAKTCLCGVRVLKDTHTEGGCKM